MTVSVPTHVMVLTHLTAGTQVRLQVSRGPAVLVFDDGSIDLEALWLSASHSAALLGVLGAARLIGRSTVSDHAVVSPHPPGGLLPEGALLQAVGRKGVETVYASSTIPVVFLEGVRTDYRANVQGNDQEVLTLGRSCQGLWQVVYVMGPARLHFSDGFVPSTALRDALKIDAAWPPANSPSLPDLPRISAITLDCNATSQTLASADARSWHAGQVLEISVFLSQSVLVTGAPKLQLRVSGRSRMAAYSGGSGSSTLRFTYRLSAHDAAQLQGCDVSVGQAVADGYPNVEAGPLWPCGALIVPLIAPLRPDGGVRSAIECDAQDGGIDIDLNELERGEGLDIDLDELEGHAGRPTLAQPLEAGT